MFKELNFIAFYAFCFVFVATQGGRGGGGGGGRFLDFHLLSKISNISSNYQPKTESEVTKE